MFKQTVCFDFDGVIHKYTSGWKGALIIPDGPVEGIRDVISELRKDYKVVVMSARASTTQGIDAIKDFLYEHDITVDEVTHKKPPAIVYIDDRAILFTGNTDNLVKKIRSFKPWTHEDYKEQYIGNIQVSLTDTVVFKDMLHILTSIMDDPSMPNEVNMKYYNQINKLLYEYKHS